MSAEILRILKATSKFQEVMKNVNRKNHKIRGSDKHMKKPLLELFKSHEECFIKFGKN